MNNDTGSGTSVAVVPRHPSSRLIFGAEALLAPKAQFDVLIEGGGEAASRAASAQLEIAADNARSLLDGVASSGAKRTTRFPRSAHAWAQSGFAELACGRVSSALEAFKTALSINPHLRNAQLGTARALNELGEHERAVQLLRELEIEYSGDPEILVALAVAICDLSGPRAALEVLSPNQPATPRFAAYFAARGSLWVALGEYRNAVRDLRAVVRWKPEWAHARNVLGIAEFKLGNVVGAERRFREAVRVAPMYTEGFLNLLRALMHQERYEDVLELCADHYPDSHSAPAAVGRIASQAALALKQWNHARAWIEAALGKASEPRMRARLQNDLGVVFANQRRFEEAERRFTASFDSLASELAIVNRGRALIQLSLPESAAEWLRTAPLVDGTPSKVRMSTLANALNLSRRHAAASEVLESLVVSGEADPADYANLVGIKTDYLGDIASALEYGRLGLSRFQDDALIANNLAYALLMEGLIEEAESVLGLERTPRNVSDEVCLLATRGLLALKQGRTEDGRRLYDQALAVAPTEALRERVRTKRDLELARTLSQSNARESARLLARAAAAGEAAYPYHTQAAQLLKLLKESSAGDN